MSELLARDTISGQRAEAFATINGNVEDLFYAKKLEATITKDKTDVKTLGSLGTQKKAVGYSGTGTMTIFYITSLFRKLMLDYVKNGKDTYFTMTVTNDDPSSTVGKQTSVLYNCNLDSTVIAKFDTDSELLEEEISFTFTGADLLDEFGKPI